MVPSNDKGFYNYQNVFYIRCFSMANNSISQAYNTYKGNGELITAPHAGTESNASRTNTEFQIDRTLVEACLWGIPLAPAELMHLFHLNPSILHHDH